RPMAADGTISISTPSALATGATADHRPAASNTDMTARIIPRIYPPSPLAVLAQCSEPHHHASRKRLTAATPKDHRRRRLLRRRIGRLRGGTQHTLDIGLHLLKLRTPVLPAVRTGGREVEHTV